MGMFNKITIIGDGAMGSVCSMLLCGKVSAVRMWGYDVAQFSEIAEKRENVRFLPGHSLPNQLVFEPCDDRLFWVRNWSFQRFPASLRVRSGGG